MDGILLVGHGSLRADSAQAMAAVADMLRARQAAHVEACFLNYGTPTVSEAAACLLAQGVSRITVQPYFLVTGQYVLQDLPAQVHQLARQHPEAHFHIAPVMGEHRLMLAMLQDKMEAYVAEQGRAPDTFILVAHGSPYPEANRQVQRIARRLQQQTGVAGIETAFLELEAPDLAACCQTALAAGRRHIAVIPFFLHAGRHVMEDLPRILAKVRHSAPPDSQLTLAPPLDDADALAAVIFDQCATCQQQNWGTTLQVRQNRQPSSSPDQATTAHVRQSLFGRRGTGQSRFDHPARGTPAAEG